MRSWSELEAKQRQLDRLSASSAEEEAFESPLTSGGLAHSIDRAKQYSQHVRHSAAQGEEWVSVFYKPHLPESVRTHLDEVGDVEQIYSLSERFPELAGLDDLDTLFPRLRTEVKEGLEDLSDKLAVARQEILEGLEDLGITQGPYGWNNPGNMSTERAMRLVAPDWINDLYQRDYMLGSFMENTQQVTEMDVLDITGMQMLENHYGRSLTDAEKVGIKDAWLSRYRVDELVLIPDEIMPMMQVPMDTLRKMMDTGFMASSPRAIGDAALLIDQNFTKKAFDVPDFGRDVRTFLDDISLQEWNTDLHTPFGAGLNKGDPGQEYWDLMEDLPNGGRRADQYIHGESPWASFDHTDGYFYFESPLPAYATLPKFRAYVAEVDAWGDDLAQHSFQYAIDPESMPDELLDEIADWMDNYELASKGPDTAFEGEWVSAYGFEDEQMPYRNRARSRIYDEYEQGGSWFPLTKEERAQTASYSLGQRRINLSEFYQEGVRSHGMEEVIVRSAVDEVPDVGGWVPKQGQTELEVDLSSFTQAERNAAVERIFGPTYGMNFMWGETGGMGVTKASKSVTERLEDMLVAAKHDSIEETKALFYDLAGKSNIMDALKFVFPFGDAWYEVLSRWAKMMNPVQSGGQSFRNVRRATVGINAARQSGFLTTNQYGEESFNVPMAPGMLANQFIPDGTNVNLKAQVRYRASCSSTRRPEALAYRECRRGSRPRPGSLPRSSRRSRCSRKRTTGSPTAGRTSTGQGKPPTLPTSWTRGSRQWVAGSLRWRSTLPPGRRWRTRRCSCSRR